jgi:hypothetical protein
MVRCSSTAFFDLRPALGVPGYHRLLVALASAHDGLLTTPANLPQEAADAIAMIAHPVQMPDDQGNPSGRPHITEKAEGFRAQGEDGR